MAEIRLFRALRYDRERVEAGAVVCPPYDVLSRPEARFYRERSPYNAIHLDMPGEEAGEAAQDRYTQVAHRLARWEWEGVLVRDQRPALYLVEQRFRGPDGVLRTRRGFVGRVRLEDFSTGVVRPHEATHAGPRRDRLALLRASRTNLSPVFLLYPDEHHVVWKTLAGAEPLGSPLEVCDADGTVHRLQPVAGPRAEEAAALLAHRSLIIADGHHRYETALAYRDERRARGDNSADFLMAYLCGMHDPGLAIFPAHRLVVDVELPSLATIRSRLAEHFDVLAEADGELPAPAVLLRQLAELAPAPAFALALARERASFVVRLRDPGVAQRLMAEGLAPEVAALPVTILHRLLLRDVFGVDPDGSEGVVEYTHRPEEAARRLRLAGRCRLAVFLNATGIADVQRVAGAGLTMPQKATYFYPKVLTGLLFNPLDDG